MMDFEYTFVKSRRKTIGITIKQDGSVVLRAPMRCSRAEAERFLFSKMDWIVKTKKRIAERKPEAEAHPCLPASLIFAYCSASFLYLA